MTDRVMPGDLLDDDVLHASSVVANCVMNRQRQLTGVNSYTRELGSTHPLDLLTTAVVDRGSASWLDLCCGTGRAMIQAARHLRRAGLLEHVRPVGVDLVDAFDPPAPDRPDPSGAPAQPNQDPRALAEMSTLVHLGARLERITPGRRRAS